MKRKLEILKLLQCRFTNGYLQTRGWQNGNPEPDMGGGGLARGLKILSDLGLNKHRDLKKSKLQHSQSLHRLTVHT
jgi:hypothetical protein